MATYHSLLSRQLATLPTDISVDIDSLDGSRISLELHRQYIEWIYTMYTDILVDIDCIGAVAKDYTLHRQYVEWILMKLYITVCNLICNKKMYIPSLLILWT